MNSLSSGQLDLVNDLIQAARDAGGDGLVVSTSGNFSARLDTNHIVISAARTRLGRLRREELLVVEIGSGRAIGAITEDGDLDSSAASGLRPSRETPMHRALHKNFPDMASVLHFQSPSATVLACREGTLPELNFIPEFPVYVRRVGEVDYRPPGSEELAAAAVAACRDPEVRVVQLRNHGQVAVGDHPAQAVERGVFFELACKFYLLSENRRPLRSFSAGELELLRSY